MFVNCSPAWVVAPTVVLDIEPEAVGGMLMALIKESFEGGAARPTPTIRPAKITNPSFTKPVFPARFGNLRLVNIFIIIFTKLFAGAACGAGAAR